MSGLRVRRTPSTAFSPDDHTQSAFWYTVSHLMSGSMNPPQCTHSTAVPFFNCALGTRQIHVDPW